jgi:hypothetical protein
MKARVLLFLPQTDDIAGAMNKGRVVITVHDRPS